MKTPLIGITPRIQKIDNKVLLQINELYAIPFIKRKINYIILPIEAPNLSSLLLLCDAFLVIGGDDLDPSAYHQDNPLGLSKNIDPRFDSVDQAVISHALTHHKPLLGICRGMQALAAFLGGSLYQDIEFANLKHDVIDHQHDVNCVLKTRLTSRLPMTFHINSYHHQAVEKVPQNFDVIYRYQDIIEGIEHRFLPILGFQWHPERIESQESEIIFDYFVELIQGYCNGKERNR